MKNIVMVYFLFFISCHVCAQEKTFFKQTDNGLRPNKEFARFNSLLFSHQSFYQEETYDSVQVKNHFTYGYGFWGVMLILPVPFIEGGIRIGSVDIRSNIGYNLAYLDARIELAFLKLINQKNVDLFFNGGINVVIQVGVGYCYGFGVDINSSNKSKFYRIELGFFKPLKNNHVQLLPRIGIGWRFDYFSKT